jgi:hypothetical protein
MRPKPVIKHYKHKFFFRAKQKKKEEYTSESTMFRSASRLYNNPLVCVCVCAKMSFWGKNKEMRARGDKRQLCMQIRLWFFFVSVHTEELNVFFYGANKYRVTAYNKQIALKPPPSLLRLIFAHALK